MDLGRVNRFPFPLCRLSIHLRRFSEYVKIECGEWKFRKIRTRKSRHPFQWIPFVSGRSVAQQLQAIHTFLISANSLN